MVNPIQIKNAMIPCSTYMLDIFNEDVTMTSDSDLFYEAVFADGKKKLQPLIGIIAEIKKELQRQTDTQTEDVKNKTSRKDTRWFDPEAFFKHQLFKKLEDEMQRIFGCRYVVIAPWV